MYRYSMTQWAMGSESLERSFQRLANCGYDAIELDGEPGNLDVDECLRLMDKYRIGSLSMCGRFGSDDRDLSADDASGALQYLSDCVDLASRLGVQCLIVVPSPVGRIAPPAHMSYEQLWGNAVRHIRSAGDTAQQKNVRLVLEPLNRYETYFVNTLETAWQMVQEINHPAVGIMADTFHMSLEESSFASPLLMVAPKLWHVHLADNTREPAGMGRTNFQELLSILQAIGYSGSMAMEFTPRPLGLCGRPRPEISSEMMDAYAMQALRHMKSVEQALELSRQRGPLIARG